MKKLLIVFILALSGCASSLDGSDINIANNYCENHGGITELNLFVFNIVTCADGTWKSIASIPR